MYISLLMPAGGAQGGKESSNFWSVPNCTISHSNFSWKVYCVLGHVIHRSKFHLNLIRSIVEIWWRSLSTCLSSQAVSLHKTPSSTFLGHLFDIIYLLRRIVCLFVLFVTLKSFKPQCLLLWTWYGLKNLDEEGCTEVVSYCLESTIVISKSHLWSSRPWSEISHLSYLYTQIC